MTDTDSRLPDLRYFLYAALESAGIPRSEHIKVILDFENAIAAHSSVSIRVTEGQRKAWDQEPDLTKEGWIPLSWGRYNFSEEIMWFRPKVMDLTAPLTGAEQKIMDAMTSAPPTADVEVTFFRKSGKYYTTEHITWLKPPLAKFTSPPEEFVYSLQMHLRTVGGRRLNDMVAVCLEPPCENAYPVMAKVWKLPQ